jgi:hypothetical protein
MVGSDYCAVLAELACLPSLSSEPHNDPRSILLTFLSSSPTPFALLSLASRMLVQTFPITGLPRAEITSTVMRESRNIYTKVKKNVRETLSPASVDKSVHKILSP